MESRKMAVMNLQRRLMNLEGSNGDADIDNRLMDTARKGDGETKRLRESFRFFRAAPKITPAS